MEITRSKAMKIWEEHFGKKVDALDFSGRKLQKGAFDQKTSDYGWCITMLIPKSKGGKNDPDNYICTHIKTDAEKSECDDMFPFFKANDTRYELIPEDGAWRIEVAKDDEAAAEQKAKLDNAMKLWNLTFGEDTDAAVDFCGRTIVRGDFGTESETAWKTAPFVESKPMENNNVYIANILSVSEALGKTAFKANGKQFGLNKENGTYFFKESETKPKKKTFDVYSPEDVDLALKGCKEEFSSPENKTVWLDFITLKAVLISSDFPTASALTDSVSYIVKEHSGQWLGLEVSDNPTEEGNRYIFIHFRFLSQSITDIERYFDLSMLLNTYAGKFCDTFGLSQFKVYNYTNCFDTVNMNASIARLSSAYPEFGALMNGIYSADTGLHDNESNTTLYVSQYVASNIQAVKDAHTDDAFYTDAVMFEHNYIFSLGNENSSDTEAEDDKKENEE